MTISKINRLQLEIYLNYLQEAAPSTFSAGEKWLNTSENKLYTAISNSAWDSGVNITSGNMFIFNNAVYSFDGTSLNARSTNTIINQRDGTEIKRWIGTQDEYDALPSYEANTLYGIKTDTPTSLGGYRPPLLSFMWSDHIINEASWLRTDTFSWQDGGVYSAVYNHLVDDVANGTLQTETIAGHTITYTLANDGHKIVLADQETNVSNIYTATGIAWYYILDTVNTRFKLPRTKWGFTGLRDTVGKDVAAGLPNITGNFYATGDYVVSTGNFTGAFKAGPNVSRNDCGTASGHAYPSLDFDASYSNSIYGNSNTVQPPATQMYLYFYVGNYTEQAIEQTAGLNSELFNDKVDLDASNFDNTGKSLIAGLGMPSNVYDDLTLGASGTFYTASANGYLSLNKRTGNTNFIWASVEVYDTNDNLIYIMEESRYQDSTANLSFLVPIPKNYKAKISYNATGTTEAFRFIYAQGSKSEAN